MTADEFRAAGRLISGDGGWAERLAEALGMSVRSAQKFGAGEKEIHEELAQEVRDEVRGAILSRSTAAASLVADSLGLS